MGHSLRISTESLRMDLYDPDFIANFLDDYLEVMMAAMEEDSDRDEDGEVTSPLWSCVATATLHYSVNVMSLIFFNHSRFPICWRARRNSRCRCGSVSRHE